MIQAQLSSNLPWKAWFGSGCTYQPAGLAAKRETYSASATARFLFTIAGRFENQHMMPTVSGAELSKLDYLIVLMGANSV